MKSKTLRLTFLLIVTLVCIQPAFPSVVPTESAAGTTANPDPKVIREAFREFKSLSKSERKSRIKEVKKQFKQYKADKKAGKAGKATSPMWLLIVLCILLPPLAVYLHQGDINTKFWVSLVLTLLFWIPGVVYAFIVVLGAD